MERRLTLFPFPWKIKLNGWMEFACKKMRGKNETQVSQVIKKLKNRLRRCKEIVVGLLLEVWNDEF